MFAAAGKLVGAACAKPFAGYALPDSSTSLLLLLLLWWYGARLRPLLLLPAAADHPDALLLNTRTCNSSHRPSGSVCRLTRA
jgi:hypothetical protein